MKHAAPDELANRRILVVEDEYMIAEEIALVLRDAGAEPLGPVASVTAALNLLASESSLDGALLDVELRGEPVWPLVDALLARNVPMLLTTGYDAGAIPVPYADLPRSEKPATGREIKRALARVLGANQRPTS